MPHHMYHGESSGPPIAWILFGILLGVLAMML